MSDIDLSAMNGSIGALSEKLGITVVEASVEKVVATMPVAGNTQPAGLLHGGASVSLAETLGSMAAWLHSEPMGLMPVGVDINATHHRAARAGVVKGTATAIHLGRRSTCHEIVIVDEDGKRVCTSRITCALIEPA